jgi:hypothetical protein
MSITFLPAAGGLFAFCAVIISGLIAISLYGRSTDTKNASVTKESLSYPEANASVGSEQFMGNLNSLDSHDLARTEDGNDGSQHYKPVLSTHSSSGKSGLPSSFYDMGYY